MATTGSGKDQTPERPAAPKKSSKESAPCIWAVQGHNYFSRGWMPFEADPVTEDDTPEMLEAVQLTKSGHFLAAERFPKDSCPRRGNADHRRRVPQIFSNGFIFIRKESADVLRRFDLGEGALYPTRLWYPDRVTPVKTEVFYLSQGNWKDAFLRERSPDAAEVWRYQRESLWTFPPNPKGGELVFSPNALDPPDLWFEKLVAPRNFFISDRLAKALREARLAADWKLIKCPISTE